ncbi:MAG: CPBP family intramembrane metalloprotease [Phycisphaerae bacterium]|nr:CPBP family intramembrane metalloprotease [Phycisphaerae bacterium]
MMRSAAPPEILPPPGNYFTRSQQPLHALMLLLPMVLLYEAGALFILAREGISNLAQSYLRAALELFGAAGSFLPGLAVVVVLLSMHIVRRDPWRLDWRLYLAMAFEAVALGICLLLFALVARGLPLAPIRSLPADLTISLGAGIYEELVFRLMLIALIHLLIVDVMKQSDRWGAWSAVLVSALLFSLYHFGGAEPPPFNLGNAVYYFLSGLYLAAIYILRGFGIVAATHAVFDIMINLIAHSGAAGGAAAPG